jgi:hypothetical protein
MKRLSKLILLLLIVSSCIKKEYRYEIRGKVYVPTSGVNPMHDAIWYTDTISFDGDTLYYFNSDGSEVRIRPPYILIDHTLDK